MALFSDDFSVDLSNWTIVNGDWSINAGRVKNEGSVTEIPVIVRNTPADTTDQFVEVDFVGAGNTFGWCGATLCNNGSWITGYSAIIRAQAGTVSISEHDGTSLITLASATTGTGPPFRMRFEKSGSFLRLYRNGVLFLEHEILGAPRTDRFVGLTGHPNVWSLLDNFEGGDIASVTTTPTLSTPTATAVTSNSISFSIPVSY